ncbi:vacuolar protein sorting-associated family 26 protein [Persicimonas caeni]|nr:sporulation protein [Persicimonas caeni]
MSKCTILVELDDPTRQYVPGDLVSGEVHVTVDSDCKCDALMVELAWETHGRGNHAEGVSTLDIPFQGTWSAGDEHTYPFRFTVPNGPYTYHGHYLNVDWYVRARADIPWAIDPKGKADFLVGPGPKTDPASYINTDEWHDGLDTKQAPSAANAGCLFFFGMVFGGFGVFMMMMILATGGDAGASVMAALGGLVFLAIGGSMMFAAVRNPLAQKKLGTVEVTLPDEVLHPGNSLPVTVTLDADARDDITIATATLMCRERVVSGSGTNKSTHTEDILVEPLELEETAGAPGGRMVLEALHRLPQDAAPSFYADDNELLWLVEVHVDVPNWPDYKEERFFEVRPGVGRGAGEEKKPALEAGAVW